MREPRGAGCGGCKGWGARRDHSTGALINIVMRMQRVHATRARIPRVTWSFRRPDPFRHSPLWRRSGSQSSCRRAGPHRVGMLSSPRRAHRPRRRGVTRRRRPRCPLHRRRAEGRGWLIGWCHRHHRGRSKAAATMRRPQHHSSRTGVGARSVIRCPPPHSRPPIGALRRRHRPRPPGSARRPRLLPRPTLHLACTLRPPSVSSRARSWCAILRFSRSASRKKRTSSLSTALPRTTHRVSALDARSPFALGPPRECP